jgi:serine/threonine protein kinase
MLTQVQLNVGDPLQIGGYRLLGRLAEGGQGVVYLALAPSGEKVVVKVLHATWLEDPGALDRLIKEVAAARRVAPFCTAQVIEARMDGNTPFIASEFVDGPSLAESVRTSGPMSGPALDRLAISTATALVAIHEAQVVHRDFKPANVVLGPDGPRVVDFGIARNMNHETTVSDKAFGTPAYMAPEQMTGSRAETAADLFGWAATMVFAATGRAPFEAPDVASLMHKVMYAEPNLVGVPPSLAGIVRSCLVKEPLQRPSARQVLLLLLSDSMPELQTSDLGDTLAQATQFTGLAPVRDRQVDPFALTQIHANPNLSLSYAATQMARPQPSAALSSSGSWEDRADPDRSVPRRRSSKPLKTVLLAAGTVGLLIAGSRVLPAIRQVPALARLVASSSGSAPTMAKQDQPVAAAPAPTPAPTPATLPSMTPTAPPAIPAGSIPIPAGFTGTWRGTVTQGGETFREIITLTAGTPDGSFTLNKFGCSGSLTTMQSDANDGLLHLHQQTTTDDQGKCAPAATVTLSLTDADTLSFQWQDNAAPDNTASGVFALDQNGNPSGGPGAITNQRGGAGA